VRFVDAKNDRERVTLRPEDIEFFDARVADCFRNICPEAIDPAVGQRLGCPRQDKVERGACARV